MIRVACQATTLDMTSEFMARNAAALEQLQAQGVEVRERRAIRVESERERSTSGGNRCAS